MSEVPDTLLFMVEPVNGHDGELIARLVGILNSEKDPERVVNAGAFIELAVGDNSPLPGVIILRDGQHVVPGSVLERRLRAQRPVSPEVWLGLVADRLTELVEFGVAEDFLVTALRDQVSGMYERLADLGEAKVSRTEAREGMLATADDPVALERYRDRVAERDPAVLELTLEQVADGLRDMAERLADPDADEATRHWSMYETWRTDCQEVLSDEQIDLWGQRRATRRMG